MMIDPTSVYFELKGQPEEKILREIRAYRSEIMHLKCVLEASNYRELDEAMIDPLPEVRLKCVRDYLEMARLALEEGGGKYPATEAEERAAEIKRRLEDLTFVCLERSSFFRDTKRLCAELTGEEVRRFEKIFHRFGEMELRLLPISSREKFLDALLNIFIGEWKESYRRYVLTSNGVQFADALDGEQWSLRLEFSEGKPLEFHGSNAYPFGFNELVSLLYGKDEKGGE